MTPGRAATSGILLWWLISLLLALPAWWMGWVPLDQAPSTWPAQAQSWALHPDAGLRQPPWVWWSAAWLHGSALHLHRNLAALGLIALLATASEVSPRTALVWALAWPLTHLGMLLEPGLHTYVGMSGVLHAGLAALCLQQLESGASRWHKWLAWFLLACLVGKILMENPWHNVLSRPATSDITVAPWAHLSGSVAGITLYVFSSVAKRLISVTRLTPVPRTLD
ncbi:MAG: rhomboid family intramembrane serine protease [Aquabacterium sp.]